MVCIIVSCAVNHGKDWSGRPIISHKSCSASIGDVDLRFQGNWHYAMNWFKGDIERRFANQLRSKICDMAAELINHGAKPSLRGMQVTSKMANNFYVDYSLVASPKVTSNYIELWDKGTVYSSTSVKSDPPFGPQSIPYWGSNSKTMYFWVTDYSFNSLLYQAHRNGDLKYQATKSNFPFLGTACDRLCIGALVPKFKDMYPDSSVEVFLTSTAMPKATMTTNRLTIDASTNSDFKVRSAGNQLSDRASLHMNASLTFVPRIRSHILNGEITRHSLKLSDLKIANGRLLEAPDGIKKVLTRLLDETFVPKLNVLAAEGVYLPVVGDVRLKNPTLKVKQGYILIETDVEKTW
ncbi:hypothetical protein RRG08_027217 [Elysia crispata]|uniref:Lipid-binding serum glycoprotein C-terminal domain-containing protein n=1 Tax=Elysia crispata TaxID=231223 RepID=A0AAE1BC78_9GAST|nr:hypothetical protein RRG08_027217 [Elysia crispata]